VATAGIETIMARIIANRLLILSSLIVARCGSPLGASE
jgi:hypothetical protein